MAESLGSAVALTAILGDKLGERVNRDQNLYYGRMGRLAEQKAKDSKEKLVTLKDFKFTGGLLPAYAGKEAEAYSNFANKFEDYRNVYGDAAAVNKAYQDRQQLDMFVAQNKANNDQTKWLIDQKANGMTVPKYDEISKVVMNPNATKQDFLSLNDPIFGINANENGSILGRPFANVDFEKMAESYRKKQQSTDKISRTTQTGNDLINYRLFANTPEDIQAFADQITHDTDNISSFLYQNKRIKEKYPDAFSLDETKRRPAQEQAAKEYATSLLRPTEVPEKGPIYHAPEGEKLREGVLTTNHIETTYPENSLAGNKYVKGTPLRPESGKAQWPYYITFPKGNTVDVVGSDATIDKDTGDKFKGTGTGVVRAIGTKPFYDKDGKTIELYSPYAHLVVYNNQTIDNYVDPSKQKTLRALADEEAGRLLPPNATQEQLDETLDKADNIYDRKLHEAGLPKTVKTYRTLEVPVKEVAGAIGEKALNKLNDLTNKANAELRSQKSPSSEKKSSNKKKIPGF